jgi:hypothetical protein
VNTEFPFGIFCCGNSRLLLLPIITTTTNINMDAAAATVWALHYAPDPTSIVTKLLLGHEAHARAMSGATERVVLRVLEQRDAAAAAVATVSSKLTAKGRTTEASFVDELRATAAFAEVHQITEKDARGKIGGDILVRDHHGNGCVVEVKDKANLSVEDFSKFEEDARAWQGPERLFVFVRKDGAGTNRRLQEKRLIERIARGRSVMWFKGNLAQLRAVLPGYLAILARGDDDGDAAAAAAADALARARMTLDAIATSYRAELGAVEKRKMEIHKQLAAVTATLADLGGAEPTSKRKRITLDEPIPRVLATATA